MYGAIIGDIVGSKYEFNNIRRKDFPFVSLGCSYTDDSIMTVAVAKALLNGCDFTKEMQVLGRAYPHPQGAYGGRFSAWLHSADPQPYNSYGNGSAMRVSPCGLIAVTLDEALLLAKASAEVTHDHPEGIKGAQAVAAAVFLAKTNHSKEEIRDYIREHFYPLDRTLDEIRPDYRFYESCQRTVPEAIQAFLESTDFMDAIRNAVSLGGDSDTIGAITGSIAWSYYRFNTREQGPDSGKKPGRIWPEWCDKIIRYYGIDAMLPEDFVSLIEEFDERRMLRTGTFDRMGWCKAILPGYVPVSDDDDSGLVPGNQNPYGRSETPEETSARIRKIHEELLKGLAEIGYGKTSGKEKDPAGQADEEDRP